MSRPAVSKELLLTEISRQQRVGQSGIVLLQQRQLIRIGQEHVLYHGRIVLAAGILYSVVRDRRRALIVAGPRNSDGTEVQ